MSMSEQDNMAVTVYQPATAAATATATGAMEMVRPLVDATQARAAIQQYEALKAAIVMPSDVQRVQGRDFLKKSFWRRVATCFGLSLELVSEERGHDESGHLFYSVIYRAIAPNGRTMTGDGYCATAEPGRGGWPEHNVRATAHTRAKNRAISDLVGGGEVSAEELQDDGPDGHGHDRGHDRGPAPTRRAPASASASASVAPQRPAPTPKEAPKASAALTNLVNWAPLMKRLGQCGILTGGDRDKFAAWAIPGKSWAALQDSDLPAITEALVKIEAKHAAAEAAMAKANGEAAERVPADALEHVPATAGVS